MCFNRTGILGGETLSNVSRRLRSHLQVAGTGTKGLTATFDARLTSKTVYMNY